MPTTFHVFQATSLYAQLWDYLWSRPRAVMAALLFAIMCGQGSEASVFTYALSSYPAIQGGATVSGSITLNTGSTTPDIHGGYFLPVTAVTAWNFSVTNAAVADYSRASTDVNAQVTGVGGSLSLYATPTTLSVNTSASLALQADITPSVPQGILWADDVTGGSNYQSSNGVGAAWNVTDDTLLDGTFPTNSNAGLGNWVIATAVPEPSTYAMLLAGLGCGAAGIVRRRRRGVSTL